MTTTVPIGPSSSSSVYPYGTYPGYSYVMSSTAPQYSDEVAVVCMTCGMEYRKWAASAEQAERACEVWLSGHRAAKHEGSNSE